MNNPQEGRGARYNRESAFAMMTSRPARPDDAAAIAEIYNEGIADRIATFETELRSADDVAKWFDGRHPIVVVESDGAVIAFASTSAYSQRECYAGIAETSVYAARRARRRGAGRMALNALIEAAKEAGFWKLVSRIFPENAASRELIRAAGFREIGTHTRHARLDGKWRDVIVVERWIG